MGNRLAGSRATVGCVEVIDSHTGGEPTRAVISGGPDLGSGSLSNKLERLRGNYDHFRSSVVNEPRGNDVMVGALLCKPSSPDCVAGVIFFNNVGYLGMCGHGSMGLAVTLAHSGHLSIGEHRLETPAGIVKLTYDGGHRVRLDNVHSYRLHKDFTVTVPGIGDVTGDIAWGGNWFFLVGQHGLSLDYEDVERLTEYSWKIRRALDSQGVRGPDGACIDHIELFGPPSDSDVADSRNFVLCPGKAYDRSPCGTGTSAKIACLFEDGKLQAGAIWRQESITGSVFEATVRLHNGNVIPTLTGSAYITGKSTLIFDPDDPFRHGIAEPS